MEEWRDIPNYESIYQASNMGRIRTCEGKTTRSARFKHRVWKQRVLKQKWASRKGRPVKDARVCLWKDGKEHTHLVSRLVASAWCAGYSDGMTVNHIDGNPENNCADNLEWVSLRVNIQKGRETGLYRNSQRATTLVDAQGKKICFTSMNDADRFLGRANGYIWGCLKRNKQTACGYTIQCAQIR